MNNVIALIPARGGSVRIKNKNLTIVGGISLIGRKILQLRKSGIENVYVGSDNKFILNEAERYGAITVMRDPLACDESIASANQMIEDFSKKVNGDIAIWAHCTNPFVYSRHYIEAIKNYNRVVLDEKTHDSLMSVSKMQSHMWSDEKKPINYNPWLDKHTLARDLKPVYFQDGAIFIQSIERFRETSYFFGKSPFLFELDYLTSFDINYPEELETVNSIASALDIKNKFTI